MYHRNETIDAIKGMCIIFIVMTHFQWAWEERLRYMFPFWINMAVPILMIISGYVYSASFEKGKIDSIDKAYGISLILRRALRYILPYIPIYFLNIIWLFITKNTEQYFALGGGGAIPLFFTGSNGPGSYYYLIMLQFIFIIPVIYFIVKRYRGSGFLICLVVNGIYEYLKHIYFMGEDCYRLLIFRYIGMIAYGCLLQVNSRYKLKKTWKVVMLFLGGTFIYVTQYRGYTPGIADYWTSTCWIAGLFIMPVAERLFEIKIKCRWLSVIGKASYNIYLIQMMWYLIVDPWLSEFIGYPFWHLVINLISCCLSGCIYYYIENPLSTKIIYWVNHKIKETDFESITKKINIIFQNELELK